MEENQDVQANTNLHDMQIGLKGPISSLDAVINNTPRDDGKTEWEHLLGRPVDFTLTYKTAAKIMRETEEEIAQNIEGGTNKTPEDIMRLSLNIHKDIFIAKAEEHAPELFSALKNAYGGEDQAYEKMLLIVSISKSGAAMARETNAGLVIGTPPLLSPKEYAAMMMHENPNDIPKEEVVGSQKTWYAHTILHELEHLTKERFSGHSTETLRETKSDLAANTLITPFAEEGFTDYYNNARMVGSMNQMTRYLNNFLLSMDNDQKQNEGILYSKQHATTHALEHINDKKYVLNEDIEDQLSFAHKIREELGIKDDEKMLKPGETTLTLKDFAQAAHNILNDKSMYAVYNPLSDEERAIGERFLKALDETGFTKQWEQAPEYALSPAAHTSSPTIKPS